MQVKAETELCPSRLRDATGCENRQRSGRECPLEVLGGRSPTGTLILDLQPPEL